MRILIALVVAVLVPAASAHGQTTTQPTTGPGLPGNVCAVLTLSYGTTPAAGSISQAGGIGCYRFSGAAGERVRVRVVATSGALQPRAAVTGATCPAGGDCTLTTGGQHSVTVSDAAGTATGGFAISVQRLNDPVGCTPLAFGPETSGGAIQAGETECRRFSGDVGDRIRIRKWSAAIDPWSEVLRPDGTTRCSPTTANDLTCTLDAAGPHTLLIRDGGAATGGYSLAIQRLNAPTGCTGLAFGPTPTAATLGTTGELDCFRINGAAGDRTRVRVIKTSGAIDPRVSFVRPDGTTVCGNTETCLLDADGAHTVLVSDPGAALGNYRIAVQRLNNPLGCGTKTYGGIASAGSIAAIGETDCWRFERNAGRRVRLRAIATSGALNATIEVLRPDGSTVCGAGTGGRTCELDIAGVHTVLVRDWSGTSTGDYRLALQRLEQPVGCATTQYGPQAATGSIGGAAELDCWQFDGSTDVVRVRVQPTSGALEPIVEVLAPGGTVRCQPTTADEFNCELANSDWGTDAILVRDSSGTRTGDYQLAIQALNDPVGCVSTATDWIGPGTTMCRRFFNNSNGDPRPVRFRVVNAGWAFDPVAEVVNADGRTVCPPTTADNFTCDIGWQGWHTLLIRDLIGTSAGAYGYDAQRLENPDCTRLWGAGDQEDSIDNPGELDCFNFRNSGYDYVGPLLIMKVDPTSGSLATEVEILSPEGDTICGPRPVGDGWFSCEVGYGSYDYTILVTDQSGTGTGDYKIDVYW